MSYPDTTQIVRLHFWGLHMLSILAEPDCKAMPWSIELEYARELEIDPKESWASILGRSVAQNPKR